MTSIIFLAAMAVTNGLMATNINTDIFNIPDTSITPPSTQTIENATPFHHTLPLCRYLVPVKYLSTVEYDSDVTYNSQVTYQSNTVITVKAKPIVSESNGWYVIRFQPKAVSEKLEKFIDPYSYETQRRMYASPNFGQIPKE